MALPRSETYTAANGTNLTTLSFTANQGAFAVNTNAAYSNSSGTETGNHDNANTYNNNQYAQGTLVALGGPWIGLAVRAHASAVTWYGLYSNSANDYTMYKMVAGTWTALGTAAPAAVNDVIYLEANGTAILAKKNGANSFGGAVTDSAISSGSAGLAGYDTGTGSRVDTTEFGNLGAATTSLPPMRRFRSFNGLIVR